MNVLLVEDEHSLLQLLGQHLVRRGFVVHPAANASEARSLLKQQPRPLFDFALIDWTLPDGNGLDLGIELLRLVPGVRVIFTSGYPLDTGLLPDELRARVRFLQKPFLPRALGEILNDWQEA